MHVALLCDTYEVYPWVYPWVDSRALAFGRPSPDPQTDARSTHRLPYKNGLLDWDCAEAIDVAAMVDALSYIRQHASFPVRTPLP